MKKKFIGSLLTLDIIAKAIFIGTIQAIVSFFAKKKLEDWDKKSNEK